MASTSVHVVIPAAVDGPRPDGRPTWMLTHPRGHFVIAEVVSLLDLAHVGSVTLGVKRKHIDEFCKGDVDAITNKIRSQLPPATAALFRIHVLGTETTSAPHTVVEMIRGCHIQGAIFVKDCDGSFSHKVTAANVVVGLKVTPQNAQHVENLPSKSFLVHNNGIVSSIHEKKMVSDVFCVGGYGFDSAQSFVDAFEAVEKTKTVAESALGAKVKMFTSHIIQEQQLHGKVFSVSFTPSFEDWKTENGWRRYTHEHLNAIVQLEGVLFAVPEKCALISINDYSPVAGNIAYLQELFRTHKVHIVITSTQPEAERTVVTALLAKHDVPHDSLMMGMMGCTTAMVGAYGGVVEHPSVVSYSVPNGNAQLGTLLHLR